MALGARSRGAARSAAQPATALVHQAKSVWRELLGRGRKVAAPLGVRTGFHGRQVVSAVLTRRRHFVRGSLGCALLADAARPQRPTSTAPPSLGAIPTDVTWVQFSVETATKVHRTHSTSSPQRTTSNSALSVRVVRRGGCSTNRHAWRAARYLYSGVAFVVQAPGRKRLRRADALGFSLPFSARLHVVRPSGVLVGVSTFVRSPVVELRLIDKEGLRSAATRHVLVVTGPANSVRDATVAVDVYRHGHNMATLVGLSEELT